MLLNLAMIKDKLPSSRILQSRVRKEHPRNLKQIRFYEKDQDLNPDILYFRRFWIFSAIMNPLTAGSRI